MLWWDLLVISLRCNEGLIVDCHGDYKSPRNDNSEERFAMTRREAMEFVWGDEEED